MNAIVNADENWGIGKNGGLLFRMPVDMAFFRNTTLGKVVVMGRRTLESFPQGKPLKNRVNIVLSRGLTVAPEGVILCKNLQELADALAPYPPNDVYCIGGASVYALLLPYCAGAIVTRVRAVGNADTFFPNIDEMPNWVLEEEQPQQQDGEWSYTICTYRNKAPAPWGNRV